MAATAAAAKGKVPVILYDVVPWTYLLPALLYPSFVLGAHGSVAAILTAAPKATVALWNAVKASDHARAHALHRGLLPLWNAMVGDNLPVCTRFAQSLRGIDPGVPRAPMPPTSAEQRAHIESSLKALLAIG